MEEDCIAALFRSLSLCHGADFSTEDVSLLFGKVFHVSSDISEAREAMEKISGGDSSWSCSGQNVLDVLLEMERERQRKEMLYWDFQLLNAGNLHCVTDYQSKNTDTFQNAHKSEPGSEQPCTTLLLGTKELCNRATNVRRLKKAARQHWARLTSEGVQRTLLSRWQAQRLGLKGQAWGCVCLSDVLLLVEVKYDVVAQSVYREMLREHHTESVWEMLSPWQQREEVKMLEGLAEEALESVDMLRLADLPGAFKIYKACPKASLGNPFSTEQSWSAVSLLNNLHTFRHQEKNTLTILGQRMCGESLRLSCLYIQLATYRAQREKMSYSALLAARQSWETWPQVFSPCHTEQVALWLRCREQEEEEEKQDFKTLQQETELRLLVLTQEQERKHLLTLLHGISVEDLQESGSVAESERASLRAGCVRRLRQIHHQLQTQHRRQGPSKLTNLHLQVQENWSLLLLEDCAILLLTHLIKLQEVQASYLLRALLYRNAQSVQDLRDRYEAELETQSFTNLNHLLMSDEPLTSGSVLNLHPNFTENTSNDQRGPGSSHTGEVVGRGSVAALTTDSGSSEQKEVDTANSSTKQEVCSGCGAIMEELPYLEILCVPDTQSDAQEGLAAEGGAYKEEESGATSEKQQSLIALAWSKPPEEDTDYEAETADGEIKQSQDGLSTTETQIQSTQCEKVQERDEKEPMLDQPDEGEVVSDSNLQTDPVEAGNLQVFPSHISSDSPESDELCSGTSDRTERTTRETTEVEMCPMDTESLRGAEYSEDEDVTPSQESTTECSFSETKTREPTLMEREQETHPVSAMEREKTMRNLVDMQRKFEEKHQRDKERQLLRVQERLLIIQNRKAEEDLLGLKNTDRLRQLTKDLPAEDKNQQKTVVRERLEQLRRERSYIMQSKRDRNTAGFKELLAPVCLHSSEREDETN